MCISMRSLSYLLRDNKWFLSLSRGNKLETLQGNYVLSLYIFYTVSRVFIVLPQGQWHSVTISWILNINLNINVNKNANVYWKQQLMKNYSHFPSCHLHLHIAKFPFYQAEVYHQFRKFKMLFRCPFFISPYVLLFFSYPNLMNWFVYY